MKVSGSGLRFSAVTYIQSSKNKFFIPALLPLKKYRNKTVKQFAHDTYLSLKKS